MFSTLSAASRTKQPVIFIASLGLEAALIALLCMIPASNGHTCCLRKDNLRAASMAPYFEPLAPPPSLAKLPPKGNGTVPELPSAAKPLKSKAQPVEAKLAGPEAPPSDTSTTAATADATETTGGASSNQGFRHDVSNAQPVFTPDPPILHGEFPEAARGKEVVMAVLINEEGSIVGAKVLQGVGYGVEESIVETLKRWVYVPAKFNGMAIASQQELHFQFPG